MHEGLGLAYHHDLKEKADFAFAVINEFKTMHEFKEMVDEAKKIVLEYLRDPCQQQRTRTG